MDNGKLSTQIISIFTLILAALTSYVLDNPGVINQILEQFGVAASIIVIVAPMILAVLAVLYNAYNPRKQEPDEVEADSA